MGWLQVGGESAAACCDLMDCLLCCCITAHSCPLTAVSAVQLMQQLKLFTAINISPLSHLQTFRHIYTHKTNAAHQPSQIKCTQCLNCPKNRAGQTWQDHDWFVASNYRITKSSHQQHFTLILTTFYWETEHIKVSKSYREMPHHLNESTLYWIAPKTERSR